MGFLDKAKAMADQAMSSLDQTVSPEGENDRRGEQLFRDLGALTWAQHRGSATQATADEIQAVLEELAEVDPNRSLNVGRKLAIQILEYFDRIGFTRCQSLFRRFTGETFIRNKQAAELFFQGRA